MNIKKSTFIVLVSVCGCVSAESFSQDKYRLLESNERYSYCTPWESEYSLGLIGDTWALTLSFPKNGFSGKVRARQAKFYQGPNIHKYIGKSAGPRRPPLPQTKEYTTVELHGISAEIKRVKVFNKVMGPIEVVVNDFSINGERFHSPVKVSISCRAALP